MRLELLLILLRLCIQFDIGKSTVFSISNHTGETHYYDLNYRSQIYECLPNKDCTFSCNGKGIIGDYTSHGGSCSSPDSSNSIGYTYSFGACECSTITCSNNGYNCNINCNEQLSCYNNIINCGDDSICNIYCKKKNSCYLTTINCGNNSQCNLYCIGDDSCYSSTVNAGNATSLSIICTGDQSCYSSTLNAHSATSLSIDVYNNHYAARGMTIYAPNTDISSPTIIKCGNTTYRNSTKQYSCDNLKIYSYEGWNDVQVQIDPSVSVADMFSNYDYGQTMYCGQKYQYFCYGWATDTSSNMNLMQCHADIVICNTYILPNSSTK